MPDHLPQSVERSSWADRRLAQCGRRDLEPAVASPDIDRFWDYKDPTGSERRFREILPNAKSTGDDAYTIELLTQIARAICLQRKYEVAHSVLDDKRAIHHRIDVYVQSHVDGMKIRAGNATSACCPASSKYFAEARPR